MILHTRDKKIVWKRQGWWMKISRYIPASVVMAKCMAIENNIYHNGDNPDKPWRWKGVSLNLKITSPTLYNVLHDLLEAELLSYVSY
jgi:hypothetical protein